MVETSDEKLARLTRVAGDSEDKNHKNVHWSPKDALWVLASLKEALEAPYRVVAAKVAEIESAYQVKTKKGEGYVTDHKKVVEKLNEAVNKLIKEETHV